MAVVKGVNVDSYSRCEHFHGELDIVAIKFPCCDEFYACYDCHSFIAYHRPTKWQSNQFEEKAIMCGNCHSCLTIKEYLSSDSCCPICSASFNPRCKDHWSLYFEIV